MTSLKMFLTAWFENKKMRLKMTIKWCNNVKVRYRSAVVCLKALQVTKSVSKYREMRRGILNKSVPKLVSNLCDKFNTTFGNNDIKHVELSLTLQFMCIFSQHNS